MTKYQKATFETTVVCVAYNEVLRSPGSAEVCAVDLIVTLGLNGHRCLSKETGCALHKYLCDFKTELGITVGENTHLPLP